MAVITIPDEPTTATFTVGSTPTTGPWTFSFRYFEKADLHVYIDDDELTQADFSVSSGVDVVGGHIGGDLSLVAEVANCKVTLRREVIAARTENYSPASYISIEDIDVGLNRQMASVQDAHGKIDRVLDALEAGVVPTDVVVSPFGETLVAADSSDAARGLLGLGVFATRAEVEATNIEAPLHSVGINLTGYHAAGDGGGAFYRYATVQAGGLGKIQSADGAWWELAESHPNVRMFGARGDGATDDTAAVQGALDSGLDMELPPGEYPITAQAGGHGILLSINNQRFYGEGTLVYSSGTIDIPAVVVTADGVEINGITIDATTGVASGCSGLKLYDANDCLVESVKVEGSFFGIWLTTSAIGSYIANKRNVVNNCRVTGSVSSGYHILGSESCILSNNVAEGSQTTDGFKSGGGNRYYLLTGNQSRDNFRDGFDFYDGFIESVCSNNVSAGNGNYGYEIKGTFGGTFTAGDYVVRDSTFIGNAALDNNLSGFSIASIRNCTISACTASGNGGNGFQFDTVQGCILAGCEASRNAQHGFYLVVSVSRFVINSCYAVDNSWAGGTTQNGTYHGFNIASGCAAQFTGCNAINGTTTGKIGGQGYGFHWDAATSGSRLTNCYTIGNVTGGIGGASGFATNNGIFNFNNNGTFKGIQYTDDALTNLSSAANFLPSTDVGFNLGETAHRWSRGFFKTGVVLTTPDGTKNYLVALDNSGALTTTLV